MLDYSMSVIPPFDIWNVASSSGIRGLHKVVFIHTIIIQLFVHWYNIRYYSANFSQRWCVPVENLGDSLLSFSFLQHHTSSGCMGEHVPTNRFDHRSEHGHRSGIGHTVMIPKQIELWGMQQWHRFVYEIYTISYHWLTTTTAILNSSAMRTSCPRCCPSFCCRSDSSPRPENSTRKRAAQTHIQMKTIYTNRKVP